MRGGKEGSGIEKTKRLNIHEYGDWVKSDDERR